MTCACIQLLNWRLKSKCKYNTYEIYNAAPSLLYMRKRMLRETDFCFVCLALVF